MATTSTDRRYGVSSGLAFKAPCKAATTANITLSGEQTIDGVALITGDRCLVKNQTTASQNGIYVVDTSAWELDRDWDGVRDVKKGTSVRITDGSTNIGYWYVTTSDPITPGTTSVAFSRTTTLSSGVTAVATYADLRAINSSTLSQNDAFAVLGRTAPGDGAAGDFYWVTGDQSANVTADPQSGIWVAPDSAPTGASGAWKRLYSVSVSPGMFGAAADGTTNDYTAVAAAIDFCESNGVALDLGGYSYKINSTLSWDYTKFTINGRGAKFDVSAVSGWAITLTTSGGSSQYYRAKRHKISGLEIVGQRTTGYYGVKLGDGTNYGPQSVFEGVVIHAFDIGITWTTNAYINSFDRCQIYDCNTVLQYPSSLTNAGERITFVDCDLFNSTQIADIQGSGFFKFIGCSFDYFTNYAVSVQAAGQAVLQACFVETDSDGDYWLETTGSLSRISLRDTDLVVTGNRTKALGNAVTSDGGIDLVGCGVTSNAVHTYTPDSWFTGYVTVCNPRYYDTNATRMRTHADALNVLVDGGFETGVGAPPFAEWEFADTLNNNDAPTLDAVVFNGGAKSLKFATSGAGRYCSVRKLVAVAPGAKPTVTLYMKHSFGGASDTFTLTAGYLANLAPAAITNPTATNTYSSGGTSYASFTRVITRPFAPAPAGAKFFYVELSLYDASGSGNAWVDDVHIEVLDNAGASLDYEQGTWLPAVIGSATAGAGTYVSRAGRYTRMGNMVHLYGHAEWSAHTGTGNLQVNNLPHKVRNWGNYYGVGVAALSSYTFSGQVLVRASPNSQTLALETAATGAAIAAVALDTAAIMEFSIMYEIEKE